MADFALERRRVLDERAEGPIRAESDRLRRVEDASRAPLSPIRDPVRAPSHSVVPPATYLLRRNRWHLKEEGAELLPQPSRIRAGPVLDATRTDGPTRFWRRRRSHDRAETL